MTGIAFEDFLPGTVIEGGPITVTRDELVAFAAEFDPQPFHLDEAVMSQAFSVMFPRRDAAPLPPRAVDLSHPVPVTEGTDAERLLFLKDAVIGTPRDLGRHVFTAEDITAYCAAPPAGPAQR